MAKDSRVLCLLRCSINARMSVFATGRPIGRNKHAIPNISERKPGVISNMIEPKTIIKFSNSSSLNCSRLCDLSISPSFFAICGVIYLREKILVSTKPPMVLKTTNANVANPPNPFISSIMIHISRTGRQLIRAVFKYISIFGLKSPQSFDGNITF